MKDKSKWFVYKQSNGKQVGCFRLKPFSNIECSKALGMLMLRKNILGIEGTGFYQEFIKIIAEHVIQDWENITLQFTDKHGFETEKYTPENAYQLMACGDIGTELAVWIIDKAKSI
ncbi:hypothetical protein [Acinetobacter larvae]|uniref:Uncharacterized protein n=1 Tax=Acinetobacter larvae TaxID=1789224 RepID=A0A1B2LZ71_9GAMM|nr:hypothetical protein [Acinetobacter larvae]AOA58234.1 hypothetical protein BFG52_07625 [Acinetobacter larvae]